MDDKKNYELFPGKTLSDLFKDIYGNSNSMGNQISTLINQLRTFVKGLDSAVTIVPLIKEYLEVKVKSDEHLVKLSDTIQRLLRADKPFGSEGLIISEEEKKQLLEDIPTYEEIRLREQKRLEQLDKQVEQIKEEFNDKIEKDEAEDGVQDRQE